MDKFTLNDEYQNLMGDYQSMYHSYFSMAEQNHLDPVKSHFPICDPVTVEKNQHQIPALFSYWKRYMAVMKSHLDTTPLVYLLLDNCGNILDCSGNTTLLSTLNDDGLLTTQWSIDNLGANAITIGQIRRQSMYSTGEENYNHILHEYTLYYMPITLYPVNPSCRANNLGGFALICNKRDQSPEQFSLLASLSHDIILNVHFYNMCTLLHEQYNAGVLAVDTYMHERPTLTHINHRMLEIFDMPEENFFFRPLENLVDPLPANPQFWKLLEQPQKFTEKKMPLTVRGKTLHCIISADSFNQPILNARGYCFYITTDEEISRAVSKKVGNTAIKSFDTIIGRSSAFTSAVQKGRLLTRTHSNIMLLGESGVGKDVFAQAIHNDSPRRDGPFIAVNCGALPRDLIASELFGYDSGAFTGAKKQGNIGKFELANGGTLFLDEIGELPMDLQATLLRAVEQKQITRLGSNRTIDVDVKIISATNADIPVMIEKKLFRSDLYYRLSTMRLFIPSLRERGEDIVLLAEYFLEKVSSRIGRKEPMVLSSDSKAFLLSYSWPGNIRELQNLMECIVQLYPGPIVEVEYLMDNISPQYAHFTFEKIAPIETKTNYSAPTAKKHALTEQDILAALEHCSGNRSEAARYLGIARKTLYRNMERLGMSLD